MYAWASLVIASQTEKQRETQMQSLQSKLGGPSGNARRVMENMVISSHLRLLQSSIQAWSQFVCDEKYASVMKAKLCNTDKLLHEFNERNAKHANCVIERALCNVRMAVSLVVFCRWRLDCKLGR